MNAGARSAQEIPIEVLPPLPHDAYKASPPPFAGYPTFYHPASGVVILGLDWMIFGGDMVTGFLAVLLTSILAFMITLPVLFVIQSRWSKDKFGSALGKAFVGAFLVAIPLPITGTLMGATILALAGLPHHPIEMLRKLVVK